MQKRPILTVLVMMWHTTFQILSIFLIATFLILTQTVMHIHAASGKPSFSLQPVTYNSAVPATKSYFVLNGQAGTTVQENMRVVNVGTATGAVSIYPVTATTSEATGIAYLSKTAALKDVAAWTKLHAQQLTLTPSQNQVISFQVVIPDSAQVGQHLGGIAAENLTPSGTVNGGALRINVVDRTIIPVEVNIPGPLVEQMVVTGAKAGGSNGYQTIILNIANTGNVMLKPTGELKVSSAQGLLLQDLPVKMDTFLPDTSINYPVYVQKKALTAGDYQVSLHLNYGHGKTLDYTKKLTITQDQVKQAFSNGPLQAPTGNSTGNSMPLWQMILVALAALIILLMGGKKVYDLISARRRKQTKNDPTPQADGSHRSMDTSKRRDKVA